MNPMQILRTGLIALVAVAADVSAETPDAPGVARADEDNLYVETGDYAAKFVRDCAWTLRDVNFKGAKLLVPVGWQQSVLNVKVASGEDPWIGTGHGREVIESVQLIADGDAQDVAPGLSAQGTAFAVHKQSWLGPYFHTSKVTVSPDGIREDFHFAVKKDTSRVNFIYVFMHCFTNDTRTWIAGLGNGEEVSGVFKDDASFSLHKDIRWAMVYAPATGIGAVYAYPEVYPSMEGKGNMFWNRKGDNKLYLKVDPKRVIGEEFAYSVRLKAFKADEAAWESVARQVLAALLGG